MTAAITEFLEDEILATEAARRALFERTRGLRLSFPALFELAELLDRGTLEQITEVLRHLGQKAVA